MLAEDEEPADDPPEMVTNTSDISESESESEVSDPEETRTEATRPNTWDHPSIGWMVALRPTISCATPLPSSSEAS